jgi:3D (Asp-Asp-Asp) domain-containing protein
MKEIHLNKSITLKKAKKIVFHLILIIFVITPAKASEIIAEPAEIQTFESTETTLDIQNGKITEEAAFENSLPENQDIKIAWTSYRTITAYNSEVGQCDDTPCITANGFNVCEHGQEDTIAANWLKFGTKVRIPELFGDRIFVVRDRMNTKYKDRVDIWMLDKTLARKFGKRIAKIEILETP